MSDLNLLLERAIRETENLISGEEFLVKDLFYGYEWNRLPLNERLRLGVVFLNCVTSSDFNSINVIHKTSSGQQKYVKR